MTEKKVRAHTNIALIKYWGKRDEKLILPASSSLSLTLDAFYTDTSVAFDPSIQQDTFYLNGVLQNDVATKKVSRFLDLFRKPAGIHSPALIKSTNFVPTAAGLASSASGMAALAGAANEACNLQLTKRELSLFARKGSGSATRSIYGGFVEWQMGTSSTDSYAVPIDDADWDIGMLVVVVNSRQKEISSREGMKNTVKTSPFYSGWLESTAKDLIEIKDAIYSHDFQKMGEITESNGMKMHGTMLGANPPLSYWEPDSVVAMQLVRQLRQEGLPCYFTMDAGPNVKVLCRLTDSDKIKKRFETHFDSDQLIIAKPGEGLKVLSE
ncbi:MAG: diphosphomevalonate decarboxylase [Carnobacterium sp.]|uniref:diphosphomevalonate decarboxylase n=1 Tax=Carnobacterium sp. TaxID=48221 RepID=UPI003C79518E